MPRQTSIEAVLSICQRLGSKLRQREQQQTKHSQKFHDEYFL